jgi:hypothetical protein
MQKNHHLITQILKKKHLISINSSIIKNNILNNNNNQNRSRTSIIGSGINSPSNIS